MANSARPFHLSINVDTVQEDGEFIRTVLKPCLPYTLPLLRRCQFHTERKHLAPNAEICLVTSSASRDAGCIQPPNALASSHEVGHFHSLPWLAAHIDLIPSGQTQIWTFASWEPEFSKEPNPIDAVKASPRYPVYQKLVEALFRHIRREHISKLGHDPPEQWQRLKAGGKIISEPFSKSKVLFGTIAECLWPFLDSLRTDRGDPAVSREDRPYLKYVVSSKAQCEETSPPEGLHFAKMQDHQLQTMIDRTNIPRTLETLRQLPNVGLFDYDDRPIAWGLLGKDGSISSLHTEPEYRKQGLAERVARQLLVEQERFYCNADHSSNSPYDDIANRLVYAHADVSEGNVASRKVMEKIGGKVMWRVAWIEIDLGEV